MGDFPPLLSTLEGSADVTQRRAAMPTWCSPLRQSIPDHLRCSRAGTMSDGKGRRSPLPTTSRVPALACAPSLLLHGEIAPTLGAWSSHARIHTGKPHSRPVSDHPRLASPTPAILTHHLPGAPFRSLVYPYMLAVSALQRCPRKADENIYIFANSMSSSR